MIHYRIPKTQKSLFSVILAVGYVAVNIACLFVATDMSKAMGNLAAANSLLVSLPATRNSILVYLLGIPFDKTIMYHRWLGRFLVMITSIHVFLTWADWARAGASWAKQSGTSLNLFGMFAWLLSLALLGTSVQYLRRRKFEVFFYAHFMFIGFYIFGALHDSRFVPYALVATVLYLLDRLIRIVWGIVPQRTVNLEVLGSGKESLVRLTIPKHYLARLFGLYKVGQYVFINFPGFDLLEWHPFSVASGPDERVLEIYIKGLGDHTSSLIQNATNKAKMWVRCDGPYGNHNLNYRRFPVLILAAGGIGLTPIISMLRDLYRVGDLDPRKKQPKSHCIEQVHLCWSITTSEQYAWFSEQINACYNASKNPGMPTFSCSIYVTRESDEALSQNNFILGRPNFEKYFDDIVDPIQDKAITVFVCGPYAMVNTCWDCSNAKARAGHRIHFHNETFEF